ncbi:MAG: response regulator [Anaerolineae bacterium]
MESHVLLIEDSPLNHKVLQERFSTQNMQFDIAKTGKEGLALAARYLPQAIIISTSLPDMKGKDVVQRLRTMTRTRHIYLMLVADEEAYEERLNALELGADEFLSAPFDPDEVLLRVRNALRRANTSNLMDPITGLPALRLIQEQLRRLVKEPEGDWALLRIHIEALDPFREVYGFQAAADLLRNVARLLSIALSQDDVEDDFLGYSGNDDFIIVTHRARRDSLISEIRKAFADQIRAHYGFMERQQGFIRIDESKAPLASLKIRTITAADGPFYDIRSLSEALAG